MCFMKKQCLLDNIENQPILLDKDELSEYISTGSVQTVISSDTYKLVEQKTFPLLDGVGKIRFAVPLDGEVFQVIVEKRR